MSAKHDPGLESHHTLVAQWETRGNDWLALYRYQSERFGTVYAYKGNSSGGGIEATNDEEAVAAMECDRRTTSNGKGYGPAFILKLDRPSLKRVV